MNSGTEPLGASNIAIPQLSAIAARVSGDCCTRPELAECAAFQKFWSFCPLEKQCFVPPLQLQHITTCYNGPRRSKEPLSKMGKMGKMGILVL